MDVHRAVRVVDAKRRGSSWPVVIETDGGRFFTKLHGAGDGAAALVAEIVVAALATAIGLRVPERALVAIDGALVCDDRDAELADLLRSSRGLNLGFAWLEGARDFRSGDASRISADEASQIVWLDGLTMNPDRTARNPNILFWRDRSWLIDHGAALVFQHRWPNVTEESPRRRLAPRSAHLLSDRATHLAEWDATLAGAVSRETLRAAVRAVPDEFLAPLVPGAAPSAIARRREAYVAFLWKRLAPPRPFV
jgi:hypothetical protein